MDCCVVVKISRELENGDLCLGAEGSGTDEPTSLRYKHFLSCSIFMLFQIFAQHIPYLMHHNPRFGYPLVFF